MRAMICEGRKRDRKRGRDTDASSLLIGLLRVFIDLSQRDAEDERVWYGHLRGMLTTADALHLVALRS